MMTPDRNVIEVKNGGEIRIVRKKEMISKNHRITVYEIGPTESDDAMITQTIEMDGEQAVGRDIRKERHDARIRGHVQDHLFGGTNARVIARKENAGIHEVAH
jgi:hypothetical protein